MPHLTSPHLTSPHLTSPHLTSLPHVCSHHTHIIHAHTHTPCSYHAILHYTNDADQNEAWELGHRQLCVAADPDVPTTLPSENEAAVAVETAAVDTQPATVAALLAETTAAPDPATALATATAFPKATATTIATDIATATATAKPEHLCVSSCCGQAATHTCAGCGLVWYCSREHQTGHWKQHKKVCKATDDVSERCRDIVRFLADLNAEVCQPLLASMAADTENEGPESQRAMRESLIALGVCETFAARCSSPWWQGGVPELVWLLGFLSQSDGGAKRLYVASTFELLEEVFSVHIMDQRAVRDGNTLLRRILYADDTDGLLIPVGVVEGVVAAVRASPKAHGIVASGILVIAELAAPARLAVHPKLLAAGAVEVLKDVMEWMEIRMLALPRSDGRAVYDAGAAALAFLERQAASAPVPISVTAPVPAASTLVPVTAPITAASTSVPAAATHVTAASSLP